MTSAQSLIGYSVAHFCHLLTLNCSNFTYKGKRLKQTVNSEEKNSLEPFTKEFKVVLLYSIKTVVRKTFIKRIKWQSLKKRSTAFRSEKGFPSIFSQ